MCSYNVLSLSSWWGVGGGAWDVVWKSKHSIFAPLCSPLLLIPTSPAGSHTQIFPVGTSCIFPSQCQQPDVWLCSCDGADWVPALGPWPLCLLWCWLCLTSRSQNHRSPSCTLCWDFDKEIQDEPVSLSLSPSLSLSRCGIMCRVI